MSMGVEYDIPKGWVKSTLGELTYFVGEKISPSELTSYNYISTENLLSDKKGVVVSSNVPNVSKVNEFRIGDTLFSNIRTYFKKVWQANINGGSSNDVIIFRPIDESQLNKSYLYRIISSDQFIDFTVKTAKGTKMPRGDKNAIKLFRVALPPLQEQKAIANVLTAFDDKIGLLQAQNKTLETMAQTIFKEWFGKYQIGDELPEGWSFSPLYSIARYINGVAFKAQDFSKDKTGLPIVKIAELKNGITDSTAFTKKVVDNKYYIDDGDILFSWSGSPETSIDIFLWSSGKAILNQHSFNVKVDDDNEKAWVYFLLKYKKSLFIHLAKMKQTTGLGHVTISDLKENYFATPPKDDRKRFGKVFNGFHQKIIKNQSQIQSLTKTRDTLLPKLMSGQVRVKNIKQTADA